MSSPTGMALWWARLEALLFWPVCQVVRLSGDPHLSMWADRRGYRAAVGGRWGLWRITGYYVEFEIWIHSACPHYPSPSPRAKLLRIEDYTDPKKFRIDRVPADPPLGVDRRSELVRRFSLLQLMIWEIQRAGLQREPGGMLAQAEEWLEEIKWEIDELDRDMRA